VSDGLEERWNDLVGDLLYSMLVVTTRRGEDRSGCLVGFTTQVSIDPPRFLVCLSEKNHTFGLARDATHLAVHVLDSDQHALAHLFGGETGDEVDKFARCAWHDGPEGLPVLDDCTDWFVGAVVETVAFGDHRGFVLEPVAVTHRGTTSPYTSQQAMDAIDAGHEA
jgi:flavin reductase (DIM6/NTAB) family NADH-FMN oxidoreductase RutF